MPKQDFIKVLGQAAVDVLGVQDEAVRIILTEVPLENWGVGARSMAEIRAAPPTTGQDKP
jgi:4-oxalocrotonate tautomerase family enzyme